ncbi:MAG: autotransporter-associated beta strand repeat-containing protein [Opitutaceae bacterium]
MKSLNVFTRILSPRSWRIVATCTALFCHDISVQAATRTWADADSDFATAGNWVGGIAPANNTTTDIASFDAVVTFQPVLAANRSINGLVFTTLSTGGLTFSGAGTLTLGSSGINNQSTSGTKLTSTNLVLAVAQTFTNNGALSISGNVNNSGLLLTLGGMGTAGVLSGNLSGTGGLTKTGAGNWLVSGTNTYAGPTTVNNGTLQIGSSSSLANSAVTINATTSGTAALLDLNGSNATITTLNFGGPGGTASSNNLSTGSGTLKLGGTVTFTSTGNPLGSTLSGNVDLGAATRTFAVNDSTGAAADLTVSADISNSSGTSGIIKTGTGTLVLSGNNSYNGATTVSAGVLNIQSDTALGSNAAGTTVNNNAALQLQNDITVTGDALSVTGSGIGGTGAVRNISGNNTWTGDVTLAGNTTVASNAGLLTFSGNIINSNRTLTVTGAGDTTISGVIGNGTGGLTKLGAGTLTLTGANSYKGGTTITSGVVNIQNNTALGTSGGGTSVAAGAALHLQNDITVTGEMLTLNGTGIASDGVLRNLSGNNTWTGAVTLGSNPGATIQSDAGLLTISGGISGNGRTLTVDGAGDTTLSGIIATTSGGITKNGGGTLTLTRANTFTGATTINGGNVSIGADNNLGTAPGAATANKLVFNGGTLATTNSFTLSANRGVTLNAGGGAFDTASSTTLTYNGIIAGTGGLTTSNSGTLVLGGANTYTGATTLNGGTLSINADIRLGAAPGSITADQLVFNGGTLATTANMALNANRSVTLNSDGGTLNVASGTALTFSSTISGTGSLMKLGGGILELGASTSMGGEFALGAGTFALNGFNFSADTLHITGNSILDFGNSTASFLNVNNLIIDAGVLLTINNWVNAVDYFTVQNDPGGSQGNPPLNQITFTGGSYTKNDTKWQPYDSQITPAPEPGVYGAVLAGAATLLLAWRRRRAKLG